MRLDEKSIHDLVGAIYDGVADPAQWQHALVQLSDATRSMGAMFISLDRVHPQQSGYVLGRLDPDLMQDFLTRHASDASWVQVAKRIPPGTTYATDALVTARELIKTQFYREILQPQQILHSGCAQLARDAERMMGFQVFRTPKVGPVDSADLRLLSLVAPHFKRAAQIAWRLGTLGALDAAKTTALEGLDHGVLLVDAGGHVLFANRAAEAIIALRDGLTVVRDGLRAALPADTAHLQTLIAEALRGAAGGTMRLTRPSLAEPFLLLVAPAPGNWHWSIDPMPAAVIFITTLDQRVAPDLRLLASAFELTATEAKIAVSIAAGGGVPATAHRLRISPNTVHTHLQRIFRKLGVNDQAALVRVLMRAVAVLCERPRCQANRRCQRFHEASKRGVKMSMPFLTASPNHMTQHAPDPCELTSLARLSGGEGAAMLGMMKNSWPSLFRRRPKASTAKQKADHDLIAGVPESEVRRNADGSIDIAFYKARALRLRQEATMELCRSIREFSRGWF